MTAIAVVDIDNGDIAVHPTNEQRVAWSQAAAVAEQSIASWLADLADVAAADAADAPKVRVWPVVIQLKHPVDLGSKQITELELRRGSLSHMKGIKLASELPADQLMLIASRLSGQTIQAIERLDIEDAGEVMAVAMDFYAKFLGSGKRGSQ